MSVQKESVFKFPKNLGCTFGDTSGKFCAAVGCWAETLRENLKDLGDTPERQEREATIVNTARCKGCPNV